VGGLTRKPWCINVEKRGALLKVELSVDIGMLGGRGAMRATERGIIELDSYKKAANE
jgi:hypothetical protein